MEYFDVAVDIPRRLITLTLRGFWTNATFDRFADAFSAGLRQLHRLGGCSHALVDGLEFAVQPLEISDRFRDLIASMAPIAARRTATIVPAQLNGMQAERAGDTIDARIFTDRQEAEAWLFAA